MQTAALSPQSEVKPEEDGVKMEEEGVKMEDGGVKVEEGGEKMEDVAKLQEAEPYVKEEEAGQEELTEVVDDAAGALRLLQATECMPCHATTKRRPTIAV